MSELIYGLANILNFRVEDQLIKWGNYTIAINSISVFSTGISTNYTRTPKKESGFHKTMSLLGSILVTAAQMAEEDFPDQMETLGTALDLYQNGTNLPCMNLTLVSGVTMEITFTDLMSFRDNVKIVRQALADSTKKKDLEMHGNDIIVENADFYGEAHFIEEKYE